MGSRSGNHAALSGDESLEKAGPMAKAIVLKNKIEHERCEAVYFLNHNELTESPAETLRTQIMHLTELEEEVDNLIRQPMAKQGIFGAAFKFMTVSSIAMVGISVAFMLRNRILEIIVPCMFMVIAMVVYVGWDSLCCRETNQSRLQDFQHHFKMIRRAMLQARRFGQIRYGRDWEIRQSLGRSDKSAERFWRNAFGDNVTRVPIKQFETSVIAYMKTVAVKMDAVESAKARANEEARKLCDTSKAKEEIKKELNLSKYNEYLTRNMLALKKLIRASMGASMHPYVTPMKFHLLLTKLGPFDSLMSGMSDLIDGSPERLFKPWFFPVPLTSEDLDELGEKMSDKKLPWTSFMVLPSDSEIKNTEHAFRLIRYTDTATKFREDVIFRSIFGFHVLMKGQDLKKIFRHEALIAEAVQEVTGFPVNVLDILVDQITNAVPVFNRISELIAFYRRENKLTVPVPFLKEFSFNK